MGAGLFNVFIERARSAAPGAAAQLANAIAARYGIDAAEVERRLSVGRFRVKGNVEKDTADSFAADLARLGAVVTVAPVDVAPPAAAPPVSLQQPRVAPPKPAAPKPPPSASPYSSGLAAAMAATDLEEPGLGALSGEFPLTLSTLDGADDDSVSSGSRNAVPMSASFGPPPSAMASAMASAIASSIAAGPALPASVGAGDGGDIDVSMDDDEPSLDTVLPASFGPAAGVTALGGARSGDRGRSTAPPPSGMDIFAPPEAQAELQLALEVEVSPRAKQRNSSPPPMAAGAPAPAAPEARPAPRPDLYGEPTWKHHARDVRVQYVAGIVVACALGLVPATVVGAIRERSAFAELDGKLRERESQVLTREDWDGLDRVRAGFAERKRADRQGIAFTSLLIWAACAGGLAYVWFRLVDWDRVLGPAPRTPLV